MEISSLVQQTTVIEAPKTFRRGNGIIIKNVTMPNAEETLWSCNNVSMQQVSAKGDYFAMNSQIMRKI